MQKQLSATAPHTLVEQDAEGIVSAQLSSSLLPFLIQSRTTAQRMVLLRFRISLPSSIKSSGNSSKTLLEVCLLSDSQPSEPQEPNPSS